MNGTLRGCSHSKAHTDKSTRQLLQQTCIANIGLSHVIAELSICVAQTPAIACNVANGGTSIAGKLQAGPEHVLLFDFVLQFLTLFVERACNIANEGLSVQPAAPFCLAALQEAIQCSTALDHAHREPSGHLQSQTGRHQKLPSAQQLDESRRHILEQLSAQVMYQGRVSYAQ